MRRRVYWGLRSMCSLRSQSKKYSGGNNLDFSSVPVGEEGRKEHGEEGRKEDGERGTSREWEREREWESLPFNWSVSLTFVIIIDIIGTYIYPFIIYYPFATHFFFLHLCFSVCLFVLFSINQICFRNPFYLVAI